jgi:hypothetical protein
MRRKEREREGGRGERERRANEKRYLSLRTEKSGLWLGL